MKIVIYGNSIAAYLSSIALSKALDEGSKVSLILPKEQSQSDMLYGGSTSPDAYDFHLSLGISEPELLLKTNSAFSFGTHYSNWTDKQLRWVQAFNLPFPSHFGAEFHQILLQQKENLQDYLFGAQASLQGRFAHPPQNKPALPLSRAEYAYHFDAASIASFLRERVSQSKVTVHSAELDSVELTQNKTSVKSLRLHTGETINADFFIDCSGSERKVIAKLQQHADCAFEVKSNMYFSLEDRDIAESPRPCISATGHQSHWQCEVPLQNKRQLLRVSRQTFANAEAFQLGHSAKAWLGNCVAISHAAALLSPHSNASYRLLKRDIERLLELIPIHSDMDMERKEYNRRYLLDVDHAGIFCDALFDTRQKLDKDEMPATARAQDNRADALLNRKIEQFLNRGLLVNYDLEPFNLEDWSIMHCGMQREPRRRDSLCSSLNQNTIALELNKMKEAISILVPKVPPCDAYTVKYKEYLKKKS
ncbi:tryptophan 7-halogenase [Glaciecola sp. MH2013]|uniref:tryptophan 7-halogenase n=1 Tax=Glaciecola sp. MH2013 TaxID=2785524 RepID=UPI00189CCDC3|nr:tryptophan 7-halogenase [Glaciecola sp. MH2013]MBF7072315.1 tryptophan 7-halogenase [Glaciecola sp. MH2013]